MTTGGRAAAGLDDAGAPPHTGCALVAQSGQRLSEGLRGWLQSSFDTVFMVADRASLLEGARRLQPALVLMDLRLAEGRLAPLLDELHGQAPASRTLVLSDYEDAAVDRSALDAGADGVVHKASLAADLSPAIDAVLAGRRFSPTEGAA